MGLCKFHLEVLMIDLFSIHDITHKTSLPQTQGSRVKNGAKCLLKQTGVLSNLKAKVEMEHKQKKCEREHKKSLLKGTRNTLRTQMKTSNDTCFQNELLLRKLKFKGFWQLLFIDTSPQRVSPKGVRIDEFIKHIVLNLTSFGVGWVGGISRQE